MLVQVTTAAMVLAVLLRSRGAFAASLGLFCLAVYISPHGH
jgi:hypothetical protein